MLDLIGADVCTAEQRDLYARLQAYALEDPSDAIGFVDQLMRQQGWSRGFSQRAMAEYRKFVFLAMVADHAVVPSDQVDQVWHWHLLLTESYWGDFCPRVLGRPLHHQPTRGGRQERETFHQLYRLTMISYRRFFGPPPLDLWPPAEIRFGRDLRLQRQPLQRWRLPRLAWLQGHGCTLLAALGLLAVVVGGTQALAASEAAGGSGSAPVPWRMVFLICALVVAAGLRVRWLIRRPDRLAQIPRLDGAQLAYLARGKTGALELGLAELVFKGVLRPNLKSRSLEMSAEAPANLSLVEQLVLSKLTDNPQYGKLIDGSNYDLSYLHESLQFHCLLLQGKRLLLACMFPILILLMMAKMFLDVLMMLANGVIGPIANLIGHSSIPLVIAYPQQLESVGGLLILAVLFSLCLVIPGERTRWGDHVLQHYRQHHDAHDPMQRVALVGVSALSGGRLDDLRRLAEKVKEEERASSCACGC